MNQVQHYLLGAETAARHRPLRQRPIPRLVESLRIRAAQGEEPREVLQGAGVTRPQTITAYLEAAGLTDSPDR